MKLVDPLAPFLRALPAVVFGRGGLAGLLANALEGRNLFLVVPGFGVVVGWLARIHSWVIPPIVGIKKRQRSDGSAAAQLPEASSLGCEDRSRPAHSLPSACRTHNDRGG